MVIDDVGERTHVVNYDGWLAAHAAAWKGKLEARANCSPRQDFSGWIEFRRVRDLELIRSDSMPFAGHSVKGAPAYVGVQVSPVHGGEQVDLRTPEVRRTIMSSAVLWDGADLDSFQMLGPGEYFNVLIPRDAIEQRVGPRFALASPVILSDSAPMRLLESLVLSLSHEFCTMQAWEFDSVRNSLIELISSLARGVNEESSAAVSDAMLCAVKRWIDAHLLDGQITSGRAAEEHGISIRSLHRLFQAEGQSFGAVVRSKRLSRALEDLGASNLSVTNLASKWGYADTPHFCRELQRTQGVTPSDYRRASQAVLTRHALM